MLPKHVRYQTALHPGTVSPEVFPQATVGIIIQVQSFVNRFFEKNFKKIFTVRFLLLYKHFRAVFILQFSKNPLYFPVKVSHQGSNDQQKISDARSSYLPDWSKMILYHRTALNGETYHNHDKGDSHQVPIKAGMPHRTVRPPKVSALHCRDPSCPYDVKDISSKIVPEENLHRLSPPVFYRSGEEIMIKTILPSEMKELESSFMDEFHIPSILLMEHAAQHVVSAISRHVHRQSPVLFLCGPGANGGDGYCAARLWQSGGGSSRICELSAHVAGDSLVNRTLAIQAGCSLLPFSPSVFDGVSLIVDSLFGTGLSRPLQGESLSFLTAAKATGLPVIAVDIPSGLDGATGRSLGPVLNCCETVTFHRPKPGLYLLDGPRCAGKVTIAPILIPKLYGNFSGMSLFEASDLDDLIPPRSADAHKGTYGHTIIFAGSEGMAGAAVMCGLAAIRAGSGLTTFLCTPSLLPYLQLLCPQATCKVLPDDRVKSVSYARDLLQHADRAVVGCGLSQSEDNLPILGAFREASCPVVWDADALILLSLHPSLLPLPSNAVITPHPGEAARLLGVSVQKVTQDPLSALYALKEKTNAHVLLKGPRTLMLGESAAMNPIGTPALAKGGSGDILAGILAALIGRTDHLLHAMQCAAYIHVRAAQAAASVSGEDCVTAQDVIQHIQLHF